MTRDSCGQHLVTGDDPLTYLEHFTHRVLQDALTEATAAYWLRRADQFEAARPRPGDFHGHATRSELTTRDRDLAAQAQACRNRAILADISVTEFAATLESLEEGAA